MKTPIGFARLDRTDFDEPDEPLDEWADDEPEVDEWEWEQDADNAAELALRSREW